MVALLAAIVSTGCGANVVQMRRPSTANGRASLDELAFMTGHWIGDKEGLESEEIWSDPRGGTMLGMGRLSSADDTVFFESMRLEARGDVVVFVAQPRGGVAVDFPAGPREGNHAVFLNPDHDYPTRIEYWPEGPAGLAARVSGPDGADPEEFHWHRAETTVPAASDPVVAPVEATPAPR